MKTSSYWIDTISLQKFPALSRDLDVDVAIIGAGITGITAAYLLKQQGAKVALLDRASWGRVDTGHTTAHLTCVTDTRLPQLVKTFGEDHTRAVWEAGMAAIDQIVTNIRTAGIECDFRWVPGYLHAPWEGAKPSEVRRLRQDAAMARKLGFKADFVPATPFLGLPGVQFFHQAKFHPTKYLNALIRTIPGEGSHVFEKTEMDEVQEKPFAIKAAGHKIRCRYLVLATHTPLMGKTNLVSATLFQTKLYLYSSYAIGAKIPAGLIPEASYWDTSDPYYYLRIDRHRGHDYAIFGGEDHKTGQEKRPEDLYKRLEKMLRDRIPAAQVDHRWSGQVIETPDGLPYIGETSRNQFVGTGFSGNGMTFGTLTAMMAVDAFCKRKNPWSELFDPQRKKIKGGAWAYLKENKDYPYYLVRDWIGGAEGTSVGSLRRGQGKILKIDGQKVAAYRNDQGKVTLCSPVCTHLKCIVRWNPAERTWDCPCHGSRFQPTGEVISGPAEEDLEKLPEREK